MLKRPHSPWNGVCLKSENNTSEDTFCRQAVEEHNNLLEQGNEDHKNLLEQGNKEHSYLLNK